MWGRRTDWRMNETPEVSFKNCKPVKKEIAVHARTEQGIVFNETS